MLKISYEFYIFIQKTFRWVHRLDYLGLGDFGERKKDFESQQCQRHEETLHGHN